MRRKSFALSSSAAALGATTAVSLWLRLLWVEQDLGTGTLVVACAMMALSVLGLVATVLRRPAVTLVSALLSLLPVGLYLLGTPGLYALIGAGNGLLLLAGAVALVWRNDGVPRDGVLEEGLPHSSGAP